ncbi:MAG: L-histidine N(alpha)-methyltransferase [Planctomycetota bacterium]
MIRPLDTQIPAADLLADVRAGLAKPGQKELPSKYFYDEVGSALFEAICALPEYGLARADARLLATHLDELLSRLGSVSLFAELGSGSSQKTRALLAAATRRQPVSYFPIDISPTALARSRHELSQNSRVHFEGVAAEYLDGLAIVTARRRAREPLVLLFLGSTIGNFDRAASERFLRATHALLAPGDRFLLSTDLVKPPAILIDAYADAAGVTAAFNLNLLARINRELGADFRLADFRHVALWNAAESRIEMHLESRIEQTVAIPAAGCTIPFAAGESIWTESSHKYTLDEVRTLAARSGFTCEAQWTDAEWPFAQSLLVVE